VPSLREGDRRQTGRPRAQWKNKPDLDSEEREMKKNVMLTPLVTFSYTLIGGAGVDIQESRRWRGGERNVQAMNDVQWRNAA
jgi:hypothetical protein